jgi:superfamily II DNA or RNA helicase
VALAGTERPAAYLPGGPTVTPYAEFLATKRAIVQPVGRPVRNGDIHPLLFPFQRDLTRWAVRKGRAALFADTGLGKTLMQLEWARLIGERTLIIAPLSVARQTVREAAKIGLTVTYTRGDPVDGIAITNYEMVEHFDPADYGAVVLDESSILKALDGKTRRRLTEMFVATPYRLCCTATPAPNDIAEIGNHAEFLGVMTNAEMLSAFFVHGDIEGPGERQGWRLKGHAEDAFFRWLASWGMAVRKPSDLGYEDDGFVLPELMIRPDFVEADYVPDGQLFFAGLKGITDRSRVRRATVADRCDRAAMIVNNSADQWIVWHGLNDEGYRLRDLIPGSRLVEGSQSPEEKAAALESFQDGDYRVLITKPRIAGFGMNFQNAHRMAFVGLSDSWEAYYQCVRRMWRFGQTEPVTATVVLSDAESAIYENVLRKEREAQDMQEKLLAHVAAFERDEIEGRPSEWEYAESEVRRPNWTMMLGDSIERMAEIADASVDLSVFSPPFRSLFTYSPSERDIGNVRDQAQFDEHIGYLIDHLLRVTKPGRNCAVHVQQVPTTQAHDGVTGLSDFRGDMVRSFVSRGWIFHGEVTIDKDPQAQAIRTKAKGLLFVQKERDRAWLRPAFADYILIFRAPGENAVPITGDQITNDEWIEWARPIWYGIRESETLNAAEAREEKDERHIAALQLETIMRCIRLWSNPGELVLDPFAGIGSTGYVAVQHGRRFIGCELKRSYFEAACRNIGRADSVLTLWDVA